MVDRPCKLAAVSVSTQIAILLYLLIHSLHRNGEIDVVEAVNQAISGNQMTLHTTGDCTMSAKRLQTGTTLADNCLNSTDNNAGCGVQGPAYTYGPSFNANGGGVCLYQRNLPLVILTCL